VADVRSSPYSRYSQAYNREVLQAWLKSAGISYVFLGDELGARSKDPGCYRDGKVQYSRLAATAPFRQGLERVEAGALRFRLALMCAEKEPLDCHRTILVARELVRRGVAVLHILESGEVESHARTMERLLLLTKRSIAQGQLLPNAMDPIEEALDERGEQIAYRLPEGVVREGMEGE
jgi:uncharacterized protein (DUF488 family)